MTGRKFRIEALSSAHGRNGFACGAEPLDRYIKTQVGQDVRRRVATCFVATEDGGDVVEGYYTLAATSLLLSDLPEDQARKLPRYPVVPAILIGRLAVALGAKGQGLASALLHDAIRRADDAGVGAYALVVDAKDDQAHAFWTHFGFMPLPGHPMRLVMPMATALNAIGRDCH